MPVHHAQVVPARQPYSHCASVGKVIPSSRKSRSHVAQSTCSRGCQSVTALAVAGGVATSSLIEDRIGGHGLHWGGALASGAICGLMCFVGLRLLMP